MGIVCNGIDGWKCFVYIWYCYFIVCWFNIVEVSEKKSDYCYGIMLIFSFKYVVYCYSKWGLLVIYIL